MIHGVHQIFSYSCQGLGHVPRLSCMALSLPVPRWAGRNADLPSDNNISTAVRVNIAFVVTFFKEYSTSFLLVCRWFFALVVLKLLMFKICVIIDISKIEFFIFSGTERDKL